LINQNWQHVYTLRTHFECRFKEAFYRGAYHSKVVSHVFKNKRSQPTDMLQRLSFICLLNNRCMFILYLELSYCDVNISTWDHVFSFTECGTLYDLRAPTSTRSVTGAQTEVVGSRPTQVLYQQHQHTGRIGRYLSGTTVLNGILCYDGFL